MFKVLPKSPLARWVSLLTLLLLVTLVVAPRLLNTDKPATWTPVAVDSPTAIGSSAQGVPDEVAPVAPAPVVPAPETSTPTGDYVTVAPGKAQKLYKPTAAGVIAYCPLDGLQRPVCAYGELTSTLRQQAKAAGREDITVNPPGWPSKNKEVTILALPTSTVAGSKNYKGWLFNRSHLIADSLGGDAVNQNLVTGTRTQNVGSAQTQGQYSGGMAYTEGVARQYLDSQDGNACPLYYAATPVYTDNELIPRTVTVDMVSCDGSINTRATVSNTANGFTINYATGAFAPVN